VAHARGGQGPFLLECDVQRWRGHAGAGDPGRERYRVPEDLKEGWQRDPLTDLGKTLTEQHGVGPERIRSVHEAVEAEVDDAFRFAQASPLPDKADLEKYLFA
jgi:pyruvate dehydrogenase E1 component alpha subunit